MKILRTLYNANLELHFLGGHGFSHMLSTELKIFGIYLNVFE